MDFSKLANLSIGLAAFLGGLYIVLQIIKALRRNNDHGTSSSIEAPRIATSGEQSIDYWKNEIRIAVKEAIEQEFKGRTEPLTEEKLRRIIRECIGDWLDKRTRGD